MYERAFKVCFMCNGRLYSAPSCESGSPLKVGEWMAAPRDGYWVAVKSLRQARYWLYELLPDPYGIRVPVIKSVLVALSRKDAEPSEGDWEYLTYRPLIVEVESMKPWNTVAGVLKEFVDPSELAWAGKLGILAVFASIMRINRFVETV